MILRRKTTIPDLIESLARRRTPLPAAPLAVAPSPSFRDIVFASGAAGAGTPGSTVFIFGTPSVSQGGVNVTNLTQIFYLDPVDYEVPGLATKYRVRGNILANATSPASKCTFGLYPVTAVAGASGGITFTLGAVVTGSTVAIEPGASSRNQAASSEFTAPAASYYALGFVYSATTAANSWQNLNARLQVRNA